MNETRSRQPAEAGWPSILILSLSLWPPFLSGCVASPPPKVLFQDATLSIRLEADGRAEVPHSHPAKLTTEDLARILAGVRVTKEPGTLSVTTNPVAPAPAFTPDEIRRLAPYLADAFAKASPQEIVTFYRASGEVTGQQTVTSGGLFVQGGALLFVMANYRIRPYAAPAEEAVAVDMDARDHPLLPIVRGGFAIAYEPPDAAVAIDRAGFTWRYPDTNNVVVVDVSRVLNRRSSAPRPGPAPTAQPR